MWHDMFSSFLHDWKDIDDAKQGLAECAKEARTEKLIIVCVSYATALEVPGIENVSSLEEVSLTGSRAIITVPEPVDSISSFPPSCLSLSLIPLIPTPAVPDESISFC